MTFDAETEALIERVRMEWEAVEGRERLWRWFALTRASWLTVPRVLMHEMPEEWQGQMARLLERFDEAFPEWCQQQLYVMAKEKGRFTSLPDALCNYRHPDQAAIASFRPKRDGAA